MLTWSKNNLLVLHLLGDNNFYHYNTRWIKNRFNITHGGNMTITAKCNFITITHWGLNKMADFLQTPFSNVLYRMTFFIQIMPKFVTNTNILEDTFLKKIFWVKFHWSLVWVTQVEDYRWFLFQQYKLYLLTNHHLGWRFLQVENLKLIQAEWHIDASVS